ncbi:MAG: leucine-rich repeat domain-containing protein [Treponema sp.]|jgi:hypothetical protein|nr:leucine-rich repeat domain-containing protein [Treponema sp.]
MKKTWLLAIAGLAVLIGACGGTPDAVTKQETAPRISYFDGDGGRGISLAILAPQGKGLAADQDYLPALVQGEFVSSFSGYSAISVLDRVNLDKVIGETLSGYYEDDAEGVIRLGHMTNTDYVMTGNLTKTSSGYSLQMQIAATADGITKASWSGTCTVAELDNSTGVRRAAADLLRKMGVQLTALAEKELAGAAAGEAVSAQTALAKGITAQRGGTVVEALSYYYEAARFDPSLAEAANRSSVLSADIQGGNIGENVRNDIQRRAAWVKVLEEAAAFFRDHPPFEILYDPELTQGSVDYDKGTVELSFTAKIIGTTGFRIIRDLDEGLALAKRKAGGSWGISVDSIYRAIPKEYEITAVLINEEGETIGRTRGGFSLWDGVRYSFTGRDALVVFSGVDANKLIGNLTVSITGVNGTDAKTAGERGYMSVSTVDFADLSRASFYYRDKQDQLWLEGLEDVPFQFGGWLMGGVVITGYKGSGGNVVIPSTISRWPVAFIGSVEGYGRLDKWPYEGAFERKHLTGVTIPNSVVSIGGSAFYSNELTRVTIPDSVTSIGDRAFSYNQLTGVTIPDSVTSIGRSAFANNKLTGVTIPDSVTSIEGGAFSDNPLSSVTLPANVELVHDGAGHAFPYDFDEYYDDNGKKAGTYVYEGKRNNKKWTMR